MGIDYWIKLRQKLRKEADKLIAEIDARYNAILDMQGDEKIVKKQKMLRMQCVEDELEEAINAIDWFLEE